MDVVQKVQNVLKSALDKPPILTGSVPKIPEHANVEWSNILPSILSGETDAISPSSSETSHKLTTERTEVAAGGAAESNIRLNATSNDGKKPAVQSDIQTNNAYGGFANNNMEHSERPQYVHYPQPAAGGAFSEKPMIPVPVITLTEQKLSTLQSAATESPVFQILSVIPVEATESAGHQEDQTVNPAVAEAAQTEETSPTEQFVELTLSEVPETSTSVQSTSSADAHPASILKQTTSTNLDSKVGVGLSTVTYSMTAPSVSTASSTVGVKQTVTHNGAGEATTTGAISSSSSSSLSSPSSTHRAPAESKNDTKLPVTGAYDDEKLISLTNTATSQSLSHAPTSNEAASHSHPPSTFASVAGIESSTMPIWPYTDRLHEIPSRLTEKPSVSSVSPTYTKDHPRPAGIQTSVPMEPLPTQLIDSFSSVMNQISETRPPVIPLSSSTSDGLPDMMAGYVGVNYDQRYNASDEPAVDTFTSADTRYDAAEKNAEHHVASQGHMTVAARLPPLNLATRTTTGGYSTIRSTTTQRPTATATDRVSIVKVGTHAASSSRPPSVATETIGNSGAPSSALNVKSTDTTSKSTTASPVWVQLEKIQNVSLPDRPTEGPATLGVATTADAIPQKQTEAASSDAIPSVTLPALDATDTSAPLKRPTPTSEYFDHTLMNLNLNDPVSAVDQVLSIAPLPSSTPTVEPISLPSDTSSLAANDLASGLIAGFATSEKSSSEETSGDRVAVVASSAGTARPTASSGVTRPTGSYVEHVTQVHKGTMALNVTVDRPKDGGVTQTSTQQTPSTNPTKVGAVGLKNTHTKGPSTTTSSDRYVPKPTKVPIGDSTKASPSSLSGNSANISGSKGNVGQSTATVTASPERLSTTKVDVRPPNADKTRPSSSQDKKNNKEKVKTTEAPIIRTDVSSELSSPVKVVSADGNRTGGSSSSTEGGSKVGTSSEKNQPFVSSTTQQSVVHEQPQNPSSHAVVDDTKSHEHQRNVTAVTGATFNTAKPSTGNAFAHNANRLGNATALDKNKGTTTPMWPSYTATKNRPTVTSRPVQSNKTDYTVNSSSPSSSPMQEGAHTDRPVIKVVTQASSAGHSEKPTRPSLVNGASSSSPADKTSRPSDKIASAPHTTPTAATEHASTFESSTKYHTSTQVNEQSDNTEAKPASLKHSENPPKADAARPQPSASSVPTRPSAPKPTASHKPLEKSEVPKTEAHVKDAEEKWTLISQQTPPVMTKLPTKPSKPPKPLRKQPGSQQQQQQVGPASSSPDENVRAPGSETTAQEGDPSPTMPQSVLPLDASQSASGLDVTVKHTSADIVNFAKLCNELAFNFWVATNKGLSTARSLALSPFGMTSLLAMIFLGARGPTSDQMNEVLGLDDVATFNPHLVFQNITDTVSLARGQGIANAAFVRELFADKMKVRKLMPFYKEQAQQFYEGLVAEVNFATISDLVRRRTNLLIRKQTGGRIKDFVKTNTVPLRSPLAALSANVFQTDCNTSLTSSVGRDGELYFAVSPAVRQRRLVPVPATTWRSGVLAGYEPSIDATAVALGGSDRLVSTMFLLPGQQGHTAPGDTLDRLEQRLVRSAFRDGTWNKLLKVLIPRSGLELQVPKFSHRSVVNATAALKRMGLDELFSGNADFKGINGVGHRLHLADVLQVDTHYNR